MFQLIVINNTPKSSTLDKRPSFFMEDKKKLIFKTSLFTFLGLDNTLNCYTLDNYFTTFSFATLFRILVDLSPIGSTFTLLPPT
jgi:hypothetical protein